MLAHSYHTTRSFEDAKNAYAKAVELDPANNGLKSNYGLLLGMSGEQEKGAQILAALVAQPGYKSAAGFANYGFVLSRMKPPKAAEAIAAYKRAIELEPTNGGLHFGLAWAHVFASQYQEAIAEFDKAASMEKTLFPDTRNGIARAQYRAAVDASAASKAVADFTKAKEALVAAEAAGRPDVIVADAIAKYEEAVKKIKDAPPVITAIDDTDSSSVDVGKLSRQLQRGSISAKVDAANALAAAGADAAEILGYALETDSAIDVRETAVRSLRKMGAGARRAAPALRRYVSTQPPAILNPTPAEMQLEFREADLRRDINQLLARLR
jgi:tetratricopeptide (TPR) repeat protein